MEKTWNFGPAMNGETAVFGASRPGYGALDPKGHITAWMDAMQADGIRGVCCLLSAEEHSKYYDGKLLAAYQEHFGESMVCSASIADFNACPMRLFQETIAPFLQGATNENRVVVHCSAGMGRTGHVLAGWLVKARGMEPNDAVRAVQDAGRNPREAGERVMDFLPGLRPRWSSPPRRPTFARAPGSFESPNNF